MAKHRYKGLAKALAEENYKLLQQLQCLQLAGPLQAMLQGRRKKKKQGANSGGGTLQLLPQACCQDTLQRQVPHVAL
jgi:hypothetical protein